MDEDARGEDHQSRSLHIVLHVMDDDSGDQQLEWITDQTLSYLNDLCQAIQMLPEYKDMKVNPDIIEAGLAKESAVGHLYLCSNDGFLAATGVQDAVGMSLFQPPPDSIFYTGSNYASEFIAFINFDLDVIVERVRERVKSGEDFITTCKSDIATMLQSIIHEAEHIRIFSENSGLNTPDEIDRLEKSGVLEISVFDCTTGFGVRELFHSDEFHWAETPRDAIRNMESYICYNVTNIAPKVLKDDLSLQSFLLRSDLIERIEARYEEKPVPNKDM